MALSGTFQKYPVSQFGLYCEWSGVQSQTDNYTDVTLKVYLHYYTIDVGKRSNAIININGTSETYSTSAIKDTASTSWKYKLLKEKTVRVYHNSNGTKKGVTLSASWSFNGTYSGTYVGTITASTSVDLNTIDRSSPTVSAEATVISSTSIKIKGTANKNCNKWEYSLNNGSSWTQYSTTNGTSAEKTLTGLKSSNYTQIKIRATRKDNGVTGTSSAVSADITLPTISFTASNITANSVYINASSSVTADIWEYSIDNGSSWTQFSTTAGTSATKTVTELTPNTTYQIKVRARKKSNGLYGTSATTSVKTLGATVLNSVNDLTVDVASPSFNINWTVYDKNYTHSLAIENGSTTIVTITGLTGSAGTNNKTITLTAAQRTSILTAMSAVKELSVSYVLTTYSGSTQIGTSSTAAGTIKTTSNTSKPTFTAFTHMDDNSTTVGVTENNQLYVQSKSSLKVTCTTATAKNGASIVKYRATIGEKRAESTTTTIAFGSVPDAGSLALIVTAIDSRGYETSVSQVITVIGYENISIESFHTHRENNFDTTIHLDFYGTLYPVSVGDTPKNSFQRARYRYKKTTDSSFSSYVTMTGVESDSSGFLYDNDAWITLPIEYAYDVQIEVSDRLSTSTKTLYVNKGKPLVSFRSERVGINTNDPQSALDVGGDIRMNGYGLLGFMAALDAETDLNDFVDFGVWTQSQNAGASTDRHYPAAKAGYLEVFTNPSGYVLQRYTAYDCTGVYLRYKYNGSWSAWKTITLS